MTDPVFYGKPLTFNPKNHRYYWDGMPVPSVTTILRRLDKPMLIQWAADMAVEKIKQWPEGQPIDWEAARKAHAAVRDEAGDVGRHVHEVARALLASGLAFPDLPPQPMSPQAVMALRAFEQWRDQHRIESVALERRVFSERYMYAGTCDFFGKIDGVLSVLDFKTGNGVYDEAWWQTSGYECALAEEVEKLPVPLARWIVHLNKTTGECATHVRASLEDWEQDRVVWLSLVKLDQALRTARKHPQPRKAA